MDNGQQQDWNVTSRYKESHKEVYDTQSYNSTNWIENHIIEMSRQLIDKWPDKFGYMSSFDKSSVDQGDTIVTVVDKKKHKWIILNVVPGGYECMSLVDPKDVIFIPIAIAIPHHDKFHSLFFKDMAFVFDYVYDNIDYPIPSFGGFFVLFAEYFDVDLDQAFTSLSVYRKLQLMGEMKISHATDVLGSKDRNELTPLSVAILTYLENDDGEPIF